MKPAHQNPHFTQTKPENDQNSAFKKAQKRASEGKGVRTGGKHHGAVPSIELYQKESCPFSHAVRNKLTHLGLDFVAHSVPDDQPLKHEQLVQAGGKDQVPFLIDHTSGVKLYDSQAILTYLDKTYGKAQAADWMGRFTQIIDHRVRAWADPIAWRLSSPLLRAQRLQLNARIAIQTLGQSMDFVRSRILSAMNEARANAQGARATSSEGSEINPEHTESRTDEKVQPLKTHKGEAVHAEVASATGSA